AGPLHGEHDVGAGQGLARIGRKARAGHAVGIVGKGGAGPGAALDHHLVAHADKPFDSIGRRRDPPFLRTTLPCYSNPHVADNPLGENEADNAAPQRICEVLRACRGGSARIPSRIRGTAFSPAARVLRYRKPLLPPVTVSPHPSFPKHWRFHQTGIKLITPRSHFDRPLSRPASSAEFRR